MSDVYCCSATLKKKKTEKVLILLQSPHLLLLLCLLYTGPGKSRHVLVWEGIQWVSWLPHLGEAWVMKDGSCDDERGARFREAGAGSSLIPSTSIQMPFVWVSCHLASRDFAARCSPSPLLKQEPNPLLTPPPAVDVSRARLYGLRECRTQQQAFFLSRMFTGLWKEQWKDRSCSWLHHWASFLALSLPLLSTYYVWVSMLKA